MIPSRTGVGGKLEWPEARISPAPGLLSVPLRLEVKHQYQAVILGRGKRPMEVLGRRKP